MPSNGTIEPGNLRAAGPYFIAGRTGVLNASMSAGDPVARLVQFGFINPSAPAVVQATPIRIGRIALRYAPTVLAETSARVFEVLKGTATGQATSGGTLHTPQRRKTTEYPAIGSTETSLYVATTDVISSGGTFTPLDASGPLLMLSSDPSSGGEAIWTPGDDLPLTLEAGEAIEVRLVQEATSATGILHVAFDFFR